MDIFTFIVIISTNNNADNESYPWKKFNENYSVQNAE